MIQRLVHARGLGLILVDLKIAAEMIELSIRLTEQGAPSPGILREAMERLERIPPRIYDLLNVPKGEEGH